MKDKIGKHLRTKQGKQGGTNYEEKIRKLEYNINRGPNVWGKGEQKRVNKIRHQLWTNGSTHLRTKLGTQ